MADAPPTGPQAPADGPATPPPAEGTGARLDRLETAQREQGGKLDRLLELVTGDGDTPASPASTAGPVLDVPAMVRQAVQDVGAEEERRRQEAAHAAEHARLSAPPPERPPTQPQGARARIQRRMYGGES